jgi:hypothetical protein
MRKSYTMAVVDPDERTATAGVTNGARSIAKGMSPVLSGLAFSVAALGLPFFLAGSLKIVYDLLIYGAFRHVRPPEEEAHHQTKLAASPQGAEISVNGHCGGLTGSFADPGVLQARRFEQTQPA